MFSQSFVKALINQTLNLDIWDSKISGILHDSITDYHLKLSRPNMQCTHRKVYCWANRVQFSLQSTIYVLPLRNVAKITVYLCRVLPSKHSIRSRFNIPFYYLIKKCLHTRVCRNFFTLDWRLTLQPHKEWNWITIHIFLGCRRYHECKECAFCGGPFEQRPCGNWSEFLTLLDQSLLQLSMDE